MKVILLFLLGLIYNYSFQNENKQILLCKKWKIVGFQNMNKAYATFNDNDVMRLYIDKDGTFELKDFLPIKGKWKFNIDSTKLALLKTDGIPSLSSSLDDFNFLIMKLTKDSLIYRQLGISALTRKEIYTDWYCIKDN